jgi:Animal haem peroxidase
MWGITRRSHEERGDAAPGTSSGKRRPRTAAGSRAPEVQTAPPPGPAPSPAPAASERRFTLTGWLAERAGWALERRVPWHRLPARLGVLNLLAIRGRLRRENLHDAGRLPATPADAPPPWRPEYAHTRSPDGTYNDLGAPRMGACGARFGRNMPLDRIAAPAADELMTPNPREISLRLLTRHEFIPARTLNVLAAAWIQFETHDWFSHGDADRSHPHEVPLADGDPWPERPMTIGRSPRDPTRPADAGGPPTHINRVTHWWDGSQVYGSDQETLRRLRSGVDGKLRLTDRGELPVDERTGIHDTGFNDNWWVGLYLLHTLFAREHNAICGTTTRPGATTSCSAGLASSTPRSWPRSTRSSGRPRSWAIRPCRSP